MPSVLLLLVFSRSTAQQTLIIKDPQWQQRFLDAKLWFADEQFKLAYPVFKELANDVNAHTQIGRQLYVEELTFYNLACELMEDNPAAAAAATAFLQSTAGTILKGQLCYYLGSYYFRQAKYAEAAEAYGQASVGNLNNNQVATMQFQHGYSLFTQKQYNSARPLLNSVRQSEASPYYVDANYYYGLIAFNDKNYREALEAFKIARKNDRYESLVPYYSSAINYSLGEKEKSIQEAEAALKNGNSAFKTELLQLLGHAYFEKGNYSKAREYLQQYVSAAGKVKREDLYELAYCYYIDKQYPKAIEQFKPLAGGDDSLSQHAMYLLGDAYLKTNQKANARNAFLFCSTNSSNPVYKEISLFQFGKLSYELGFDNEALNALQQYVAGYPKGKYVDESRDLLLAVLANTSNYKEALELYESLPAKSENAKKQFPRIAYNRAQELLNDRKTPEAEKLLKQVIAAPYNNEVKSLAYFWMGELDFARNKYADAVLYMQNYLGAPKTAGEANPNNAKYTLGYGLLRLEQYNEAASIFSTLTNASFANAQQRTDVNLRLADCYYMQKEFSKASPVYNQVAALRSFGADYSLFQLGMIAGAQNKPAEKITTLRSIESLYPSSSLVGAANMEIADTYLADEKFKESLPFLTKIMNGKTDESLKPQAYLKAGLANYNLGNNNEALSIFRTLLKRYPQSAESEEAIDNVRSIYVEMGKPEAYVSFLKEVGKKVDTNVADSITYVAAELQLSEGKKTEALASLKNYLQQYPDGIYALDANYYVGELLRENKQLQESAKYYDKVASVAPNKYAERVLVYLSRMHYFDFKDYPNASKYYGQLKAFATTNENRLEAMRGLVRSQYYQGDFVNAVANAKDLLQQGSAGSDDKVFANMVLGKQARQENNCGEAITYFKAVSSLSKAEFGAEARYQVAQCLFDQNKLAESEKAAFEVIQKSGSYEYWVTKSYLLLGDIFLQQKDYFNAKATYKSVADNATIPELKKEAETKLAAAEAAAAAAAKIEGGGK